MDDVTEGDWGQGMANLQEGEQNILLMTLLPRPQLYLLCKKH